MLIATCGSSSDTHSQENVGPTVIKSFSNVKHDGTEDLVKEMIPEPSTDKSVPTCTTPVVVVVAFAIEICGIEVPFTTERGAFAETFVTITDGTQLVPSNCSTRPATAPILFSFAEVTAPSIILLVEIVLSATINSPLLISKEGMSMQVNPPLPFVAIIFPLGQFAFIP